MRSFTLACDTAHPRAGVPFDVTLSLRVADNVRQFDDVYLPAFFGPEELGDERQIVHDSRGTLYRETLRLVSFAHGPLHIEPASLEAIDARDGKPKRFYSNALDLQTSPPAPPDILRPLAALVLAALLSAAGYFALRRPRAIPRPVVNDVARAMQELRRRRDRGSVLDLRAALWASAGARDGETLHDVLARVDAVDERARALLLHVEEAAFVAHDRLAAAVERVLADGKEQA